jgi:hypothetical protein
MYLASSPNIRKVKGQRREKAWEANGNTGMVIIGKGSEGKMGAG